jgi:uncharacterized protein (TIGR04255 family)
MALHRHLTRAPLREALVDIQFEPRVSLEDIDRFVSSISGEFPRKTDIWEAFFGLNLADAPGETQSRHQAIGRRLESTDEPFVLQCRVSGFTLSRLSPYGEWSDLRAVAHRLWGEFLKHVGMVHISRIAVRYINEIRIPLPIRDFADYLTCPPTVPDALPQALTGFLSKVIIPDESMDCVSVVTQAFEGPPSEGPTGAAITVILDIDVFRTISLDNTQSEKLWEALDTLRDQKNRMFFEHLQEKTVEMYT